MVQQMSERANCKPSINLIVELIVENVFRPNYVAQTSTCAAPQTGDADQIRRGCWPELPITNPQHYLRCANLTCGCLNDRKRPLIYRRILTTPHIPICFQWVS